MQQRVVVFGLSAAIVFAAVGCAPQDAHSVDEAQQAQDRDAAVAQQAISWTEIYEQVLVPNACVGCHGKAAELDLSLEHGYENLVGVAAKGSKCAVTAMQRVEPGDPDASILFDKLLDTPICGARMPMGMHAVPVTAAQLELVRAWIADGAKK